MTTRGFGTLWGMGLAVVLVCGSPLLATARQPGGDAIPTGANGNDATTFIALPVDERSPRNGVRDASDLITISLDDVEMVDVVRMFGRISGANIIAAPETLTARVTANLQDVEWRPALSSILAMHDMALIERTAGSGVYSVVERLPDAPEPMLVRTFFLRYTTVSDVTPVVRALLPEQGSISTFPSRGALVVRSTEANLNEIEQIVGNIDIQSQQVSIETQFMELTDEASRQLGIKWDSLESFNVGFQAGPFTHTRSTERGFIREDSLTRGDRRSSEDVNRGLYDVFGNRYQAVQDIDPILMPDGTFTVLESIEPTRQITDRVEVTREAGSDISQVFARTIAENSAAILNMDSLNLVLSALKRTDGVSIISNPKMIVTSGTTNAFFRVGQREPIIRQTIQRGTTESPGDVITAELDTQTNTDYIRDGYLHTGIELQVIPTVKTEELIEAEIAPSLRRKIGDKTVEGNSWPIISVKEIRTLFTLSSDQTVAIGGLTDSVSEKQTSKVPLLGDIPIIGRYLFSHTRDVDRQTETIIFVTLSLAEPRELKRTSGIPERAELVHKRRFQDDARRAQVQEEVRRMEEAARVLQDPESGITGSHSGLFEP